MLCVFVLVVIVVVVCEMVCVVDIVGSGEVIEWYEYVDVVIYVDY